jgi:hypothetical protein
VKDEVEQAVDELEEKALREAMWGGVLAVGKGIPMPGNNSRTCGDRTDDGMGSQSVRATYKVSQPDGSQKVYVVTVSVEESTDHRDSFWGPGGVRDGDDPLKRVVVNGDHYYLGDDKPGGFKGFGGHRWEIEFFDGRKVITHDLWHQGTVPPKWRERYPDNAKFIPQPTPADTWAKALGAEAA